MKILIILIKMNGGVGRANTEIAKVLRKKGHEIDFLSREDDLMKFSMFNSVITIRNKVKEQMKEKGYDIIYTQDYSMALSLLFPYPIFKDKHLCCYCGIKDMSNLSQSEAGKKQKSVYRFHLILHRLIGKMMGKRLVVIGDQLKELFPKSTKIYRGVNPEKFNPLGMTRDSIGWYESDNETITKKELTEIGKMTGLKLLVAKNIPSDKMNEFYNRCKVFINLPRTAGFNLSWLEAMSAGVPIVIGNYKGAGSFLPINKISKEKNKVNEIINIIKNPKEMDYRKWLIDRGFTWEKKAEELIKFFEKRLEKNV